MEFSWDAVGVVLLTIILGYFHVAVVATVYILLRWMVRDPNWRGHTIFRKPWILMHLLAFYWPVALFHVLRLDLQNFRYTRRIRKMQRRMGRR